MSNIDKQALREIAAAAVGAHERLSVMPPDDIFDISLAEGPQLDADITALNALNSAANPTTVLALLDELEKTQAQSSKWCEAFHKAVSVGARYEERIAELEAKLETADKLQDSAFR
ncbi:ead/Ea22-like family protein, partial [Escherichia coli]